MKRKTVKHRKDTLVKKWGKLRKQHKEIIKLDAHLRKKGFRQQKKKNDYWGITTTCDDKGKKSTCSVIVQDYYKPNSKDGAAIAQTSITALGRTEVYSFCVIVPKGKIKEAKEYKINKKLQVEEAKSWLSCVIEQLASMVTWVRLGVEVGICTATAIAAGPYSLAVFLGCLAVAFALELVIAIGRCTCNCQWYCVGFWGCYHQ